MKSSIYYTLFLALINWTTSLAQLDSVNQLDEVVLSDVRLIRNSDANLVRVLQDSALEENRPFLTSLLRFNTPIFLRENGPGMVASASFRGTTASQTAVVWNGININSQFNGQTDFNTLLTTNYDNVAIRSGGGSMLYGSGAIGGSIHLNNRLNFNRGFQNRLRLSYGSYDTFLGSYTTSFSKNNFSVQLNLSRYSSDNDFRYPGTDRRNLNGDFEHSGLNLALAYRISPSHILKFYTNYFNGIRGLSGSLTVASNSKYENQDSRNLLEWKFKYGDLSSETRLAYLDETFRYFENREKSSYSFGRAKTGILKHELVYELVSDMKISSFADLHFTQGEGTNLGDRSRTMGSVGLLFEHRLGQTQYQISGRKQFTSLYSSPFLFSLSAAHQFTSWYGARFNISRNYRIPTFNDLFWYSGGNQELQPEKALQVELGQELRLNDLELGVTLFVLKVNDLLRWVPGQGGLWKPQNTDQVRNYGLELVGEWKRQIAGLGLHLSSTYAYVKTEDLVLDKALIYTPRHKATAALALARGSLSSYYQLLYTGRVFTSSDNAYFLEAYTVSNLGLEYDFLEIGSIGAEVSNLFNIYYENMPSRPMPGRSFHVSLTFNF